MRHKRNCWKADTLRRFTGLADLNEYAKVVKALVNRRSARGNGKPTATSQSSTYARRSGGPHGAESQGKTAGILGIPRRTCCPPSMTPDAAPSK